MPPVGIELARGACEARDHAQQRELTRSKAGNA